jgi:L,D-peptidoglycan transpeptidase YkuD (ErfK/YbiS/YcfS/YnhG family)
LVDDPDSDFYNKYVVGTENKDWNSAERMIEYNGYRYGFVVDYNVECIKGAGSAIFFHIGSNPTAGCVATSEEVILKYLSLLDKNKNPYVLIY